MPLVGIIIIITFASRFCSANRLDGCGTAKCDDDEDERAGGACVNSGGGAFSSAANCSDAPPESGLDVHEEVGVAKAVWGVKTVVEGGRASAVILRPAVLW